MRADAWPHPPFAADWTDERLIRALVFSVVVHLALLLFWVPQHLQARQTGSSVLTVMLSKPADRPSGSIQQPVVSPQQGKAVEYLTSKAVTDLHVLVEPANVDPAKQRAMSAEAVSKAPGGEQTATPQAAASGGEYRSARRPGEARVALEIGEDGRVGQILWYQLPAMTDEQLFRLEATIRERYKLQSESGHFVRQTIDVRDFIGADLAH